LLCGLTVTADGVPVWGHVTEGNRRDSSEQRFHIPPLRQFLPDVGAPLVIAASKFFAGETIAWAAAHRFRFVTLGPQTVGLRQEVVDRPARRVLPLLWEQPGRRTGPIERDHGAAVVRPDRGKTAAGEVQEVSLRLLVVESSPLAKAKAPRVAAAQRAEQAQLATLHQPWQRRTFACEADAPQAAHLGLRELSLPSPRLLSTVGAEWVPEKRGTRGRPRTDAPRPERQIWRVRWQVHEATEAIMARAQREGRFVLATHVLATQGLSDADLLRAYTGQPAVELRCKWAKNPAAMAPIFLETPTRIAALGGVYVIALRGYTLVERQVRKALAERGETVPDRPSPSQRPTARTVFHLMRHMAGVTVQWARRSQRQVTMLNVHQLHGLRLLGYEPSIYTRPRRN
jgi:transposase